MADAAKTAFISGAAKRIGRALALHLAGRGWNIAAQYRGSAAAAERLAAEIEALGRRCGLYAADFADPECIEPLCERVTREMGPPDLVVSAASIFERDRAGESDIGLFQRQMTVNALHPILVAEGFARRRRGPLLIVNFLDQKIANFSRDYFTYTLSKVALEAATKIHAFSLGEGVRVNAVAPGIVLPSGGQSQAAFEHAARQNPAGAIPSVEEICGIVDLMLASPAMNGTIVFLDGGRHLARSGLEALDDDMGVEDAAAAQGEQP